MILFDSFSFHPPSSANNRKLIPGCSAIVSVYIMGRDPKLFDDPEVFRPERFDSNKSNDSQNPFKYIPFSAGARNCIGQKFAILEMKSFVTKILRNYEIFLCRDTGKEPALNAELVLRPESPIYFKIKPRIY